MYEFIHDFLEEINKIGESHSNPAFKDAVIEISSLLEKKIQTKIQGNAENQKILERFLSEKNLSGCSKGTLSNYRFEIQKFLSVINKPVSTITGNDIKAYITSFSDQKKSTIATKLSIIKSFFYYLTEENIVESNPTLKIKKIKEDKLQPKFLTMVEMLQLREACGNDIRARAILELLFETGCRVSEIVNINLDEIDWEKRSVKIWGKGAKERTVLFHINTQYFLKEYLSTRSDNCPALFVSKTHPINRLTSRSIQLIIKNLGNKANLNKKIHPHVMRHTFSTYLLNKGMSIEIVAELLGHERLSTTQIYAKVSPTRKETEYFKYFS